MYLYLNNFITKIQISIISLLLLPGIALSHNNPEFTNKLLKSIEIDPSSATESQEFTIEAPKESVRIIWEIKSENKKDIVFSIKQGDSLLAKDIHDGSETVPNVVSGTNIIIADIKGTESKFNIDISAKVIIEKKKNKAVKTSAGKRVYKKANCIGCHKWHGDGGGGYGGAALSLRTTGLDAEGIKYIVRCGRPETGMPFHGRDTYKGEDNSCYNKTGKELGENIPPRARKLLSERELNSVVDYVVHVLKGSGKPNFEQCAAFWGEKSRQCESLKK